MIERDKEYYNQKISELYAVIENQEKIIRDLQSQNQQLKEHLKAERKDANQVQDRIDKVIEYIEENKLNGNKISEMLCGSEIIKLLEILKGDNNE